MLARLDAGITQARRQTEALLLEEASAQSARIAAQLEAVGAPAGARARKVVRLFEMDGAVGLADLGQRLGLDETVLTRAFTHLGQALGLDWAQATAARIASSDPWERLLLAGLRATSSSCGSNSSHGARGSDPQGAVDAGCRRTPRASAQFKAVIDRARHAAAPNAAMLAQIAGQARVLLGR